MPKRILAIDLGRARIGLALSDEQKIIASALPNIEAAKEMPKTVERVLNAIQQISAEKKCEIEEIVVGLPLKMNGTDSDTTAFVRQFHAAMKEATPIPIVLLDERLTSIQADRALMEFDFTRKKRAQFVDRLSAAILLQCYLERRAAH